MYPVSQDFLEKIKQTFDRAFEVIIEIQHSKGVLSLYHKDLVNNALIYTESSQAGEEFTIGSTVASDISFTILNKPGYEDIQFIGATVFCNIGLLVKEGADAHFLQPSQPSKMPRFDEKWEYVPLGRFNIDYVNIQRNSIELKAIDNMINLDKPYSLSKLSYPATLYQIYVNACNVCDVLPGTTSFPNMHYVVQSRPDEELTFRDILGYVAELSGTFAKCNRNGAITLDWYKSSGITLGPANRFDFKASDDIVQIKGVMATVEDTTYLAGSEDYAIDLSENPLLQGNYQTVLPNIFNNVKDTIFTPYTSGWQGNPAIQAGDMLTQVDRDGKEYNTLITKSIFKYRGRSTLEAKGLPEISKGYKGSTNRKIAQIKKRIEEDIGDQLSNLEQAQLNATELLANMLGGYIAEDKTNGILYIADNPNINQAMKVWKYGINGFGYSENGVNGPYTTAVTADGSIVAELVSAGIITANMVQTGILQSNNGKSWFDLDSGIFRISHGGIEYTQADINGFGRNYGNGIVSYLNGIYMEQFEGGGNSNSAPPPVRVTLPQKFKGRQDTVKVFVLPTDMDYRIGRMSSGSVTELARTVRTRVGVAYTVVNGEIIYNMDLNATIPWVDVDAYTYGQTFTSSGSQIYDFDRIGFILVVIGE